jgi:NTP pyrophosphatase (non-canonical NTP hydrolase)
MTDAKAIMTLGKFTEELTECASAASRCLIQGIDECEPTTGKVNREWLEDEIADVIATLTATIKRFGLDMPRIQGRAAHKLEFLQRWVG